MHVVSDECSRGFRHAQNERHMSREESWLCLLDFNQSARKYAHLLRRALNECLFEE